jgi:hypothetical protein
MGGQNRSFNGLHVAILGASSRIHRLLAMDNPTQGTDHNAAWIWSDADGAGRNVFARFRRRFTLDARPEQAFLALFGDARWRLRVDGAIVAYGPGRFVTGHPAYDRIDLKSLLDAGQHELLVEVCSPGASSFQVMPESSGGFIAWGSAGPVNLATPGAWEAQRSGAWDGWSPSYSFAQGPVEILTQGLLDADPWQAPVLREQRPWGELQPRSIPALGLVVRPMAGLRLLAAIMPGEQRLSCRCRRSPDLPAREQRFAYALPIHSPRAQRVELGLFWGPHWVNGVGLEMANHPLLGSRQQAVAELRAGWNLLYGEPQVLTEVWPQHIALPAGAGLRAGVLRNGPATATASMPSRIDRAPATIVELDALPIAWQETDPAGVQGGHPARDLAWDRPGRIIDAVLPARLDAATDPLGWVVLADAGGEFLGHIQVEIEAPAGTVLDIASDERLRSDGLLGLYTSNPFVDGADRVILGGGRQVVELFHPRGGRFVQLAIRPPSGAGMVTLHSVAVRDHQVPVARDGAFRCSDPQFDWTWETAHRTLQACVEDAFLDCPWRERGTYLGDALVESATLAAFDRNPAVARRTLQLFAQSQTENGQMLDCAPSWHRNPFGDFTCIWVLFLHQLWSRDGRLDQVRPLWDAALRILDNPIWMAGPEGLCGPGLGCFIDWGVAREDRSRDGNACLTAFYIRALACAVEMATALGRDADAQRLRARHDQVLATFRRVLWLPAEGRFARCLVGGRPDPDGFALHANALVLAFGLADASQEPAVLAHTERLLDANLERCLAGQEDGYLELYFLSYALEGLYRCGRSASAERIMREHWGYMHQHGAWTFWEALRRGTSGAGSMCHAWSSTPARWFHERVLGVRPLRAGDPSVMLIAPDSQLEWAEGTVPHPDGLIQVAWRRVDGRIEVTASAPPGVSLRIVPDGGPEALRPLLAAGTAGR